MRYSQFIYTTYKKYRAEELGLNSGYDVFAKTEGISEEDGNEIIACFNEDFPINDPRLTDVEHIVENVEKYAPKQRAFLRLSSGKYCWCQKSLVPFDFTNRYHCYYFHAVISEDEPDFNPIEFFDNFEFRSKLTDAEFKAQVPPPVLPVASIDRSSMRRTTTGVKLNREISERLLSCILYCVRNEKPLYLNCETEEAYDIIKNALSFLPLPIAKKVYFSTYSLDEREDGKIYRIAHMGKEFNYEARLANDYIVIADLDTGKFSPHVPADPFVSRLVNYLYTNGAEADKFRAFYETYTGGSVNFDAVSLLNAYDFIYTDAYKRFDMNTMQSVISDPYISTVAPNLRATRYEEYLKCNQLTIQERGLLLSEVYKCIKDKKILLDYTGEILADVIKGKLALENGEELLKRTFNYDFKTVILGDLQYYNSTLSANIFTDAVFSLVCSLLASSEKVDRTKAEALYAMLYNSMSAKGDIEVLTGKLLPALKNSGYFTACAHKIFVTNIESKGVAYWLNFALNCADEKIREIFLGYTLDYINNQTRLTEIVVTDRGNFGKVLGLLKELDSKGLAQAKIFLIIKGMLATEVKNTLSVKNAVAILKFYDVMNFERINELYDVALGVLRNPEELFIELASEYGDEYIKRLSRGKYAQYGEKIIANSITSASDFIERYVKNFYLKGIYADSCNAIIDKIAFADETEKWYFYSKIYREVAGAKSPLSGQAYMYLNAKICEISHKDRKEMSKALQFINENTAKPSSELELFHRLCQFDGKYKTAVELESYTLQRRDANGDLFRVVLKHYYDVLVAIALAIVKKKKKSDLIVEIFDNPLNENQCAYVWKNYFEKDKKAQLLFMLDLLRTASTRDNDICSLLAYYYKNADERVLNKFAKIVSKQKDASKQKDEKLAEAHEKYKKS